MAINDISRLPLSYHNLQVQRVNASVRRIQANISPVLFGRVIPDPEDLPIGKGRRLEASILFLDISGFTNRPSNTQAEQEENVRALTLLFGEMIRIVGDYGGVVEKNTGDGLMAYFSRGGSPGDPRQRALACAMTMFYAGDNLINPVMRRSGLVPLDFRICIDFGWITIARLGAARRFNHIVAIGSAANRTSKMLGFASGGEIMIGDDLLGGLPPEWLAYVTLAVAETAWTRPDGQAYPFYVYDGRWISH